MPELCNIELTFDSLVAHFERTHRVTVDASIRRELAKGAHVDTNLDAFGETRQVGPCTQFAAIFVRNMQYLVRNPRTMNGAIFSGIFTALLCLALYW